MKKKSNNYKINKLDLDNHKTFPPQGVAVLFYIEFWLVGMYCGMDGELPLIYSEPDHSYLDHEFDLTQIYWTYLPEDP